MLWDITSITGSRKTDIMSHDHQLEEFDKPLEFVTFVNSLHGRHAAKKALRFLVESQQKQYSPLNVTYWTTNVYQNENVIVVTGTGRYLDAEEKLDLTLPVTIVAIVHDIVEHKELLSSY